ncbi:MAG: ATP-binding protein [Haloarculaceae archaeon]
MSHRAGDVGEWEDLLAGLPVMYVSTRAVDGRAVIESCNQRLVDRLGHDRASLVGTPLADVYGPASAAALRDGDYRRAMAGDLPPTERQLRCADGTVLTTRARSVPRTDADGRVVGTRTLLVDVGGPEQRRRQVDVLNRLLRHNLRNDMTVLLSHAAVLADAVDGEAAASADRIVETVRRWEHHVEKVQRIRAVLSSDGGWRPTDLATVLDTVEADLSEQYPDARLRLLRPPEGLATIRPEMELALIELCENAIRHAEAPRPEVVVTVSAPPDEPWVKLTVTDDGPAIPDSELVPLRDDESTHLLHGSGLGLWVVRFAVDRVGGTVEVVENSPAGTAVVLCYPDP